MDIWLPSTHTAFSISTSLITVGAVTSSLELLFLCRGHGPGPAPTWTLVVPEQCRQHHRFGSRFGNPRATRFLLMSHIALALGAAALLWMDGPAWILLSGLTLATMGRNLRFRLLLPAAATMELMVLLPTTLWSMAPWNHWLAVLCLGAIAAQASIAYAGSGLAKLRLKDWRRGYSLLGLFDRSSFAISWLGKLLRRHPRLRFCLTWGTMAFELTFFVSLLAGPVGCIAYLLVGAGFHFAIMALLGIHPFFWAFTATYPAVWFTSVTIFRALYHHS